MDAAPPNIANSKSALDRIVRSLCSGYDVDALPYGIRDGHTGHSYGHGYGYSQDSFGHARASTLLPSSHTLAPSIQLLHETQCSCTLPSLSLKVSNASGWSKSRRRRLYTYDDLSYTCASTSDQHLSWIDDEHLNLQKLLSREAKYANPSSAASAFLRNLVASFGSILEFELIRRLQNVCEKLDRLKESETMQRKKDKIMDSFLKYSNNEEKNKQSMSSPAIPTSARIHFYTSMPIRDSNHSSPENKPVENGPMIQSAEVTSSIAFKAELRLYLPASRKHVDVNLRTTGEVHGRSQEGVMGEINVSLDMDILCASIRKECRHVTKEIINAMAGIDLFERKSKARRQGQTQTQAQQRGRQRNQRRQRQGNEANNAAGQNQTVKQLDKRASYVNIQGPARAVIQHGYYDDNHQHRGTGKRQQNHPNQAPSDDSKTQPTLDGDESTTASFDSSQLQNTAPSTAHLQVDQQNLRVSPGGTAQIHQIGAYASSHTYTKREKKQDTKYNQKQREKIVTIISPAVSSSSSSHQSTASSQSNTNLVKKKKKKMYKRWRTLLKTSKKRVEKDSRDPVFEPHPLLGETESSMASASTSASIPVDHSARSVTLHIEE